jgi:hypothetical protein
MSRAIALVWALSLTSAASAAPRRARRPVVPKTTAADQQTFEQTFEFILQQAGQSYLKNQAMPEPAVLQPFLDKLQEPELGKAKANLARLEDLISNAEAVQQGMEDGITADVYKMMVDQAADDLGVGTIVEQAFLPNQRAGRSMDGDEKTLVSACQAEARDQSYDRRAFYERCLGQRRAESVYLSASRSPASQAPPSAAALHLIQEIQAARAKQASVSDDVMLKLQETQNRLLASLPANASIAPELPGAPQRFQSLSPRKPASVGQDPFAQAKGLKFNAPPLDTADLDAGVKLARVAKADEIGFTGYCYSYVKSAMQKAGIVDKNTIAKAGAAGRAKQFAGFVDKNPALLKRKLRRIPNPSWPLPIGTIVVWSAGACHFDADSGHIEIVTRIKPPQACSDGCETFQTACLDQLAGEPARAASQLPKAQDDVRQAQAAADAAPDRAARRKAALALSRAKNALAALQAKQEPAVAAYVIERQSPSPLVAPQPIQTASIQTASAE